LVDFKVTWKFSLDLIIASKVQAARRFLSYANGLRFDCRLADFESQKEKM